MGTLAGSRGRRRGRADSRDPAPAVRSAAVRRRCFVCRARGGNLHRFAARFQFRAGRAVDGRPGLFAGRLGARAQPRTDGTDLERGIAADRQRGLPRPVWRIARAAGARRRRAGAPGPAAREVDGVARRRGVCCRRDHHRRTQPGRGRAGRSSRRPVAVEVSRSLAGGPPDPGGQKHPGSNRRAAGRCRHHGRGGRRQRPAGRGQPAVPAARAEDRTRSRRRCTSTSSSMSAKTSGCG